MDAVVWNAGYLELILVSADGSGRDTVTRPVGVLMLHEVFHTFVLGRTLDLPPLLAMGTVPSTLQDCFFYIESQRSISHSRTCADTIY